MPAAAPMPDNPRSTPPASRARAGGSLLATKLYAPTPRTDLVERLRLHKLLDENRTARLILLSAPAGSGKTTLLAAFLQGAGRPAGWFALDAADNDPARFLAYIVAAATAAAIAAGQGEIAAAAEELQNLLRAPEAPAAEAVLADLINLLAPVPGDLTLVLDDYHVIASPAVHAAVAYLLDHLPPNLHIAIATRADPPLPLARLRLRGQLLELRAGDLRFTPEEAAAFFDQTMGLALSPAQTAALGERTEGWIAGLQLAALSMRGRADVDSLIGAFTGSHRFILDFLLEEVLGSEPEPLQQFLLQTAVLNPFCAELCDAVTGRTDSRQMLDQLERRNLFVTPLDDDRCWYRYHQLFADLLQARLRQSEPAQAVELQARAAAWCEREGLTDAAIGYALSARDYTHAAVLVSAAWGARTNAGEVETAWAWLASLPPEVVRRSAPLSVACCWVLWLKGQPELMEPHLQDAETTLAGPETASEFDPHAAVDALLPVHVAALRSFVARYRADFTVAVAEAERARLLASENLPTQAGAPLQVQLYAQLQALVALALATACDGAGELARAADAYAESIRWSRQGRNAAGVAVTYRLAGVLRLLGRLDAAEAACRSALRFLEEQGLARLPAAGVLHIALAEVLLERNQVAAAEEHLARGGSLGRRSGRMDAVRNTAALLVRLRLAQGEAAGALAAVDAARAALGEPPSPLAEAELLGLRARVLARLGLLAEAAVCIGEAGRLAAHERGLTRAVVALAAARVWPAQDKPAAVARHLAQLTQDLAAAEKSGWLGAALELRIVRSLLLARQEDASGAAIDLQAALALAEQSGCVRLFLDEGEPMRALLRRLAARPDASSASSPRFLDTLLETFDIPTTAVSNTTVPSGAVTPPITSSSAPHRAPTPAPALIEPLSARELEVLHLLAEGLTNEQIARCLIVALGTVKAHIHNIAGKLGAQNRAHAVARARELGLL